jgi:hypothetical protein
MQCGKLWVRTFHVTGCLADDFDIAQDRVLGLGAIEKISFVDATGVLADALDGLKNVLQIFRDA